ncbi:hypothetical protein E2562_006757 [Oryza meyeriana var. granulata]|uniref:Uncharacterized protein n=1 Tax=Oryza meyeriana var. granulata TaxID=110450 RepID=A0A6G1C477_9ORYZ|nr:hypothetical protein E2562_006757 [Oryza meyeriana var. granulata]
MTTTMSFSPARQLASLPLMKKKGPDRSNVNTVLLSSNLSPANDANVLHACMPPDPPAPRVRERREGFIRL